MQPPPANGHQQTEPHAREVEDPLCHHKPNREEQVGGWHEGDHHQSQGKHEDAVLPRHSSPSEQSEGGEGEDSEAIPEVCEGGDGRDGIEGDLCTQAGRERQQHQVVVHQIQPVELTIRSTKS